MMACRAYSTLLRNCAPAIRPQASRLFCRSTHTIYMEPSKVKYDMIEDVERLDFYVPGGYHPAMIGDKFCNGRYVIAHKLGFGRSATVWLAEDREESSKLVALKISTSESAHKIHEMQILSRLEEANSDLPGKNFIQKNLDSFRFSGPNGVHQCLVTDAARASISEAKTAADHRLLHLPAARAIASQLILGVRFIHSQGIVHGDLHLGNILLHLPIDMQHLTYRQLYKRTGQPTKHSVHRKDKAPLESGVPSEVVVPTLEEAFNPQEENHYVCHTPRLYAPPESFFNESESKIPLSFPGDMWTLACIIWELFGAPPPFESIMTTPDQVLKEHVEVLGKLPDHWWAEWTGRNKFFDDDGTKNGKGRLRQYYSNAVCGWNERQAITNDFRWEEGFATLPPEEQKALNEMLRSMLVFEPGKRATIEEVENCEWMQKWGLPEMQKMMDEIKVLKAGRLVAASSNRE